MYIIENNECFLGASPFMTRNNQKDPIRIALIYINMSKYGITLSLDKYT